MTEKYTPPQLGNLQPEFDETAQLAHERMASTSLDALIKDMPKQKTARIGEQDKGMVYAELTPTIDYESDEAVVLTLPFANGFAPHMYLRAKLMQEAVMPNKRVIVFPQNTLGMETYNLSKDELKKVASGDLHPIAERQARLIKALGIGRAALIGYSFGAMNQAVLSEVLADQIQLMSVGIFEPPNVVEGRSAKQLSKDFQKPGFQPFIKSVQESQIPALNEAFGINGNSTKPSFKMLSGVASFGLASMLKPNKAVKNAMTYNNLSDSLSKTLQNQPETNVLLANVDGSLITPIESLNEHAKKLELEPFTASGHGHAAGDNIAAHAMLAKKAMHSKSNS